MPRWDSREQSCINIVRERLGDQFAASPSYPEVIGDRKIIRYLRGHDYNIDKVCTLMSKFLNWRKESNVNEIRKQIVEEGCDHPLKFPKGEIIIKHIPQLVIAPDAFDRVGSPIVVEQYNFSPSEAIKHFSIADYVLYVTYCLEYRAIILEQLSEEREQAYLQSLTEEQQKSLNTSHCTLPPYGVVATTCIIRDLKGVGFDHLGSQGIEIISAVVSLASDNYPELMRKCYMINSPWIFNTAWYVIKQLLAPRTIAKVSVMGSNYEQEINIEIPRSSLPKLVGGEYIGYSEYTVFPFNRVHLCPHLYLQEEIQSHSIIIATSDTTAENTSVITKHPATITTEDTALQVEAKEVAEEDEEFNFENDCTSELLITPSSIPSIHERPKLHESDANKKKKEEEKVGPSKVEVPAPVTHSANLSNNNKTANNNNNRRSQDIDVDFCLISLLTSGY